MKEIIIYTDGACRGNQNDNNIGAWAYRLEFGEHIKEYSNVARNTTNNIMELTAVIQALRAIKPGARELYTIKVYSDSQYVVSGVNEWSKKWIKTGFKNVKNTELWKILLMLIKQFPNLTLCKVSGHSGHEGNERVDFLCNEAMDKIL